MDHVDRSRYHYWVIITIISHQVLHFLPFLPSILNGHDRRQYSIILSFIFFLLSSLYMFILFSNDKIVPDLIIFHVFGSIHITLVRYFCRLIFIDVRG